MKKVLCLAAAVMFASVSISHAESNSVSQSASGASSGASVSIKNGKGYRPVGAAIAPGLTSGAFSCNGSVSAGVGGSGFGLAFGTTVMDRDCNSRENAKIAAQAFGIGVGRAVLCNIREIAEVVPACAKVKKYRTVADNTRSGR